MKNEEYDLLSCIVSLQYFSPFNSQLSTFRSTLVAPHLENSQLSARRLRRFACEELSIFNFPLDLGRSTLGELSIFNFQLSTFNSHKSFPMSRRK